MVSATLRCDKYRDGGLRLGLKLYPCELLFVHRDAESQSFGQRFEEIDQAVDALRDSITVPPVVRVVPVRMMEAWLLQNEAAIRRAARNPNGTTPLNLPSAQHVEGVLDPKDYLTQALVQASGLRPRRRRTFQTNRLVYRVAELIEDFSILDAVPAFSRFNEELRSRLRESGMFGQTPHP